MAARPTRARPSVVLSIHLDAAALLGSGALGVVSLTPREGDENDGEASPKALRVEGGSSPRFAIGGSPLAAAAQLAERAPAAPAPAARVPVARARRVDPPPPRVVLARDVPAPAPAAAPPAWAAPLPDHGVIALGSLSPQTLDFLRPDDAHALFGAMIENDMLAVQGFSKGGGYGVLQFAEEGHGEAYDALRGMHPRLDTFLDAAVADVARALRVEPSDVKMRFTKIDSGGAGGAGGGGAVAHAPIDGSHATHSDVDTLHNARVCVSLFFVDEGAPPPPPYALFAGRDKAASLAQPPQLSSVLQHGCIQAMVPATGWHGTGPLPPYLMRFLFVFDVDVARHAINGGEDVHWPAATPFLPREPVVVDAGTAARLREALQRAPQSRESAKQAWLGWIKGKEYQRFVLRERRGTITPEEQRDLDHNRQGLQGGGASCQCALAACTRCARASRRRAPFLSTLS